MQDQKANKYNRKSLNVIKKSHVHTSNKCYRGEAIQIIRAVKEQLDYTKQILSVVFFKTERLHFESSCYNTVSNRTGQIHEELINKTVLSTRVRGHNIMSEPLLFFL